MVVVVLELEERLEKEVTIAARSHPRSREYAGADNGRDCLCFVPEKTVALRNVDPPFLSETPSGNPRALAWAYTPFSRSE